jgi:serine/threonine-protein kinase
MTQTGILELRLASGAPAAIGRYEILGVLGRGGMATVYLGRGRGQAGFSRLFAIKVLHPHLSHDHSFVKMLFAEGQIAARIHHPNVVPIVDVGTHDDLQYVVLDYVEGCSLSALLSHYERARPPRLLVPIVLDALSGLHAAHTLADDDGRPMNLVHRDVSPQNVLVGVDGTARLTDFGVAKARTLEQETRPGTVKGKIGFLSPEQVLGLELDGRSDLFSAGCLLWSALTGNRLFYGDNDGVTMRNILEMPIPPPSQVGLKPSPAFDEVCLRALERDREKRWASAAEMEDALRKAAMESRELGSKREVSEWAMAAFGEELEGRRAAIRAAAALQQGSAQAVTPTNSVPSGPPFVAAMSASHRDTESTVKTAHEMRGHAIARPHRGRRVLQIAAGAGACVLLAGFLLLRSQSGAGTTPSAGSAPPPAPTPSAAGASPGPVVSSAPMIAPPPASSEPPTPSASAQDTAKTPALKARPASSAAPRPHGGGKINCNPPFVVDANGIEHYKPGCL